MAKGIGSGEYSVQIVGRGGSPFFFDVPWSSISFPLVLNNTAQASVTFSRFLLELKDIEPYEHEFLIYRDKTLIFAGPIITHDGKQGTAFDLSHWFEVRFMPNFHGNGDSGDVFRAIADLALEADTSPNIEISTRQSGVHTTVDFKENEFHRGNDALRSLATYGIDWTVVGRRVLAGGKEIFLDTEPLILHDDGVLNAANVKEGQSLATDVAVFGATPRQGQDPIVGRATTGIEKYGLVQRSFTELLVREGVAADASADARVEAMQPTPRRVKVTLSPEAPFTFEEIVPGRRFDVRLTEKHDIFPISEIMRLQQANVNVSGAKETVVLDLIPLGVTD